MAQSLFSWRNEKRKQKENKKIRRGKKNKNMRFRLKQPLPLSMVRLPQAAAAAIHTVSKQLRKCFIFCSHTACTLLIQCDLSKILTSAILIVNICSSASFGVAFDIDGVILRGATPIGNSRRALRRLYDDSGTHVSQLVSLSWSSLHLSHMQY